MPTRLVCRLNQSIRDQVEAIAAARGVTLSDVMREALQSHLATVATVETP